MQPLRKKFSIPALCLAVGLAVFGVSYAVLGEETVSQRSSVDDLFDVITDGDAELLEQLLRNGADPNTFHNGMSALHWTILGAGTKATIYGQVKTLIAHGANPNLPSDDGMTPVHAAALNNVDEATMEALLEAGGNALSTSVPGVTPYQLAVMTNSAGAVAAIKRALGSRHALANQDLLEAVGAMSKKLRSVPSDASSQEKNAAITAAMNRMMRNAFPHKQTQ